MSFSAKALFSHAKNFGCKDNTSNEGRCYENRLNDEKRDTQFENEMKNIPLSKNMGFSFKGAPAQF